jgi:hypothetical protein
MGRMRARDASPAAEPADALASLYTPRSPYVAGTATVLAGAAATTSGGASAQRGAGSFTTRRTAIGPLFASNGSVRMTSSPRTVFLGGLSTSAGRTMVLFRWARSPERSTGDTPAADDEDSADDPWGPLS